MNNLRLLGLLLPLAFTALAPAVAAPPPAAFGPVPGPAQMRWHKAESIMFAHFGMKTFHPNDDHKGTGTEDPASYNPEKFDAKQWVDAAKAGGFKGIVLTTKHHDGFCNWATDSIDRSVAHTPWRGGKCDVVKEFADACHKGGVYFGLYVSILDESYEHAKPAKYPAYSDFYYDQLKELSTRYGRVDEYWFDGFGSETWKVDYEKIAKMIAKEQPDAVIYDSFTMAKYLPDRCLNWPGHHGGLVPDQTNVRQIPGAPAGTMGWYPNEASIILQGNWFNTGAPSVSAAQMVDLYLSSTGVGSTPLMNVPPNKDGLIDADTVEKLKVFKKWVEDLNADDITHQAGVKISDTGHRGGDPKYAAKNALDGNYDTYFATDDGVTTATIEVTLPKAQKIGGFILQEYIPLGERIQGYAIECRVDGVWKPVFAGKNIGYKRIILEGRSAAPALAFNEGNIDVLKIKDAPNGEKVVFPVTDAVRLKILNAKACPLINHFQILGDSHP